MIGAISSGVVWRKSSARISNISRRFVVASSRPKTVTRSWKRINEAGARYRSMSRRRFVGHGALDGRPLLFLEVHHREGVIVPPFPPRARIVPHLLVAGQLQDEVEPGRADPARAVAHDLFSGRNALLLQNGVDRVHRLDGAVGVAELIPGHIHGGGDVAAPGDPLLERPVVLFRRTGVGQDGARMGSLDQTAYFGLVGDQRWLHIGLENGRTRLCRPPL